MHVLATSHVIHTEGGLVRKRRRGGGHVGVRGK